MNQGLKLMRRPTTPEDCETMIREVRDFSRNDLFIATGDELEGLKSAVAGSRTVYSGFVNDKLGIIYGIRLVSIISNHAYVWLLTTKLVESHWVLFMRVVTIYTVEALTEYDKISVICPLRNKVSQRWLTFMGFVQGPMVRMHGMKFKTYSLTKENVNTEKLAWLRGDEGWQPLSVLSVE